MPPLPIRGFQIHLTHYDHDWWLRKDHEIPFDIDTGLRIVSAMGDAGLNLLAIDCADAVEYASHPELRRHYTQPMRILSELADAAHARGIETMPVLGFAQSDYYHGNDWFRPHNEQSDTPHYWKAAFELIDELIEAARPRRFFNIGMDEDHWRTRTQYVDAVATLRAGLTERGLRAVMWNMSAQHLRNARAPLGVVAEKALDAEPDLPRDVVQVFVDWSCNPILDVGGIQRIVRAGFEIWGNPGPQLDQNRMLVEALQENGGSGMLFTRWIPCIQANLDEILSYVRGVGAICALAAGSNR